MASENTMTAEARPRQRRKQSRKRTERGSVQERIMAYSLVHIGAKGVAVAHIYGKKEPNVTRCGLKLERGEGVRNANFSDYSESECQICCELFGVARLWQIYPPMNLGEHLWDERGRRR